MPVPFGCIPQDLSLVVCVYTLIVKVCSMERTAAATSSSGEPASICLEKQARGSRSDRLGPHSASCFQSWRQGKEMTWGKRCGMAFHECAVVISWKKNPKQSQWKWGWSGHCSDRKKKKRFLLVVVVPFRSFWFVLLNYGGLEFPNYQNNSQSTPTFSVCACECRLLFPEERDIFNKLIRWHFPIQSLSGNWSTAWHVRNEKMCLRSF